MTLLEVVTELVEHLKNRGGILLERGDWWGGHLARAAKKAAEEETEKTEEKGPCYDDSAATEIIDLRKRVVLLEKKIGTLEKPALNRQKGRRTAPEGFGKKASSKSKTAKTAGKQKGS